MDVKIAMVKVNNEYWLDRQIAKLRGGQKYSHGAFIVYKDGCDPEWWDVHWRWVISDLRCIPAMNYCWEYDIWDIRDLTEEESRKIYRWLETISSRRINYDLLACIGVFIADKIGLSKNPFIAESALYCFELLMEGMKQIGREIFCEESLILGSDLECSGLISRHSMM